MRFFFGVNTFIRIALSLCIIIHSIDPEEDIEGKRFKRAVYRFMNIHCFYSDFNILRYSHTNKFKFFFLI